ncbi:hypothetical protein ACTSKR_01310 [Chitinibacteraceae bacterium HSL-7]
MRSLSQTIGLPRIAAVVDEFLIAALQHPVLAPWLAQAPDLSPYRNRLVTFWCMALDGESYRLTGPVHAITELLDQMDAARWRSTQRLLASAIRHHVPRAQAMQWLRRLDQIGATVPA